MIVVGPNQNSLVYSTKLLKLPFFPHILEEISNILRENLHLSATTMLSYDESRKSLSQQAVMKFPLFLQGVGVTSGKDNHKHSHFTLNRHMCRWSTATQWFPKGPEWTWYLRNQHHFSHCYTPYFHFLPPPKRKGGNTSRTIGEKGVN